MPAGPEDFPMSLDEPSAGKGKNMGKAPLNDGGKVPTEIQATGIDFLNTQNPEVADISASQQAYIEPEDEICQKCFK